jgi:hypothetical protein
LSSKSVTNCRIFLSAAFTLLLDGWALNRTKGTEHAAIARIRAQQGFAVAAFVEKQAGICGHPLNFSVPAVRAG